MKTSHWRWGSLPREKRGVLNDALRYALMDEAQGDRAAARAAGTLAGRIFAMRERHRDGVEAAEVVT